ncbi:hypothetical protein GBA52_007592 [Prunus armeniaca]|nr:hypothetical protein GBA52_007592 [Prunus armeniaca]
MCGSNEEGKSFGDAFDNSISLTLWRYVDVFWRIKKFLNLGSEAALRKNTKIVNDFVFKLIHNKIEQMQKKDNGPATVSDTYLQVLSLIQFRTMIQTCFTLDAGGQRRHFIKVFASDWD